MLMRFWNRLGICLAMMGLEVSGRAAWVLCWFAVGLEDPYRVQGCGGAYRGSARKRTHGY